MVLDAYLAFTVDTSTVTDKMTRYVCCFSESLPLPFAFADHATPATLSYPHFRLG